MIGRFGRPSATTPQSLQRMQAPGLIFLTLLTGLALAIFTVHLPVTGQIAQDFGVPTGDVLLGHSYYLIGGTFVQLLGGIVSDRYGRRWVLIIALGLVALSSVICALAPTVEVFQLGRLGQCVSMVTVVLSRAMVRDTQDAARRLAIFGYLAAASTFVVLLGPVAGGLLADLFDWRAIFIIFAVWSGVLALVALYGLAETHHDRPDRLSNHLKAYRDLMQQRLFWGLALSSGLSLMAFYVFISGFPMVASRAYGITSTQIGGVVTVMTAGYALGGLVCGRFGHRFSAFGLMVLGRGLHMAALIAGLISVAFLPELLLPLTAALFLAGLGDGLTVTAATTELANQSATAVGFAVSASGAATFALGSAVTTLVAVNFGPGSSILLVSMAMLAMSALSGAVTLTLARPADGNDPALGRPTASG